MRIDFESLELILDDKAKHKYFSLFMAGERKRTFGTVKLETKHILNSVSNSFLSVALCSQNYIII
jgi:hypothetical protein